MKLISLRRLTDERFGLSTKVFGIQQLCIPKNRQYKNILNRGENDGTRTINIDFASTQKMVRQRGS